MERTGVFKGIKRSCKVFVCSLALICSAFSCATATDLPVKVPDYPIREGSIRNHITFEQLHNITGPDSNGKGLMLDLGDTSLFGTIYSGPYPFEAGDADFDYARYRKHSPLNNGQGLIRISDFFKDKYNANDWPEGLDPMSTKNVGYRLDLWRFNDSGLPVHLGFYDSVVAFRKEGDSFEKNLTIVEGPFVCLVTSNDPRSLVIKWETDLPSSGTVYILRGNQTVRTFNDSNFGTYHEVQVSGLIPHRKYTYYVESSSSNQTVVSEKYYFHTAPPEGRWNVVFGFAGDSREGVGGGERNYMGCNFYVLNRIAEDAYRRRADFFIFGGDLINGYTSDSADFDLQLRAYKQAMAGFMRSCPVYTGMGNHETLLNVFDDGSNYGISLDKWPYNTYSAEAIFAKEFVNPENGPETSDPRRPTYRENVYTFTYGPVQIISFNNNYWWTSNHKVQEYGGSPEGYILDDQLQWIENTLDEATNNPKIKYVFLFAQEPVFPCGGHTKDAMWWLGNNNMRAYVKNEDGEVVPAGPGMIEVRNRFWKAVSHCPKVAAVLTADEHEYHRTLITSNTPVGVYPQDDTNGDGILDQYSPDPEFLYPTWHITVGTAGAPYYNRQETPWSPVVLSSQHGYALIKANNRRVSLEFRTITGQIVDRVSNLMSVKTNQ